MLSPQMLREMVIPWYKKYVELAHDNEKMFWLHSCGNIYELFDDLAHEVGIDAQHSFQNNILPIEKFFNKYASSMAAIGGVDVDKLCRMDKSSLVNYVEHIIEKGMEYERWALRSGNSIASFVPVENYLLMLERGLKWNDA